ARSPPVIACARTLKMLQPGQQAPVFSLPVLDAASQSISLARDGKPTLLFFFESDCPTCHLTIPYLNRLSDKLGSEGALLLGISQDGAGATRQLAVRLQVRFPVVLDEDLEVSRQYDPIAVPTIFLVDRTGAISRTLTAFDKSELNAMTAELCEYLRQPPFILAAEYDGIPHAKPGCTSRHLEPKGDGEVDRTAFPFGEPGQRADRIELPEGSDAVDYCLQAGFDPLPVVPPTSARVEEMLRAVNFHATDVIALVPPNYGQATVEKIAANAVMAGCQPTSMRVLIPLMRAACDERFNLHGVQATTHFAAPLVIVNGPIRGELGFACSSNVFSNVTRTNSTIGRALQLMLTNLGGALPGEIDMSTLGNPGKFSYCIAENEEESPWEPLHFDEGFDSGQSALTLFAAEPPRGVSEHNARSGRAVLKAICRTLATIWSYRMCTAFEALVVICPEHARTLERDGFAKADVRNFLFENTGIPQRAYDDDDGEGVQYISSYQSVTIDGEACFLKFRAPGQIKLVVAGGTAGKFSAVIGSWATGPRGSQMVTYPID
ncbi:MAG: TlpA disulfide reductase family protein, partial [Acidobacteriota bacterium]